uniref:Reverse transcriptase domain-containing protein n=1 Tax=Trichuris muris TaxID=70415 RepID=A0A5S6QMI6_TRIMR
MDELLDELDRSGGGFTLGESVKPNCLAFADDILLLSDTRSLQLNVQKCCSLMLYKVPRNRSVAVSTVPEFYLDPVDVDTVLPVFTPAEFLKYLGVEFSPFGRRRDQVHGEQVLLDRACKAELKPQQKIELIRSHLLPRLLYTFTVGNPLANTASAVDKIVRQAVKKILHLPLTTICDDFFYLPKKHGGLGFINLQETADLSTLRLMMKMSHSNDQVAQVASELSFNQYRRSRLMARRSVASFDANRIHEAKMEMASRHAARFLATYQGCGYQEFKDKHSNKWIVGDGMTGHCFIAAIKVRTSLVPTRIQSLRGRADPGDRRLLCRRCGPVSNASETLIHISQRCALTHGLIIRRHNTIMQKLASIAKASGFQVICEPVLRHQEQVYKPDLLLTRENTSWVIDIAIPWETNDSLNRRHTEKCRKYECLSEPVLKLKWASVFKTGAIVIGARGAWCSRNDRTLCDVQLHVSDNMKCLLCLVVLERTIQLISWFMRSTDALAFRAS